MPPLTSAAATRDGRELEPPGSPRAVRLPNRRWRDWRLALGGLLVLGSALAGARVVALADDTAPVWAARESLVPGTPLVSADLVAVPARIEASENPYLTGPVPDGFVVVRGVRSGELVPATAVVARADAEAQRRLLALSIPRDALPGELAVGDRVDVWRVPERGVQVDDTAALLVAGVAVAELPTVDSGFAGGTSAGSVVVVVDDADLGRDDLADVTAQMLAASAAGQVALTLDPTPR